MSRGHVQSIFVCIPKCWPSTSRKLFVRECGMIVNINMWEYRGRGQGHENITANIFHSNIPSSVPVPSTLSRTLMNPFPVPFPCLLERTLAPPSEPVGVIPLRIPKRPQKAALIRRGCPMIALFFLWLFYRHTASAPITAGTHSGTGSAQ